MKRYAGVSPFSSEQSKLFFGREQDINDLHKLIRIERKVLLYSKSGIGKSSLIKAGVLPRFDTQLRPIEIRFFAYNEGQKSPCERVLEAVRKHKDFKISEPTILDRFVPEHQDNLWYVFKNQQIQNPEKPHYVLIFDQFEELFSYPESQILDFKTQLSQISSSDSFPLFFNDLEDKIFANPELSKNPSLNILYESIKLKCVFIIRSDRLSQLNQLTDKLPDIQRNYYELKPLTIEQARQAIVEPAKKEGKFDSEPFHFEEKALEKIINHLSSNSNKDIETTQLQIICQRIEKQNQKPIVTENDIPNFKNIFYEFYNESIESLPEYQQDKARELVEDKLIYKNQRISLDGLLCLDFIEKSSLESLVDTHLLRSSENSVDNISYELSHDTLIEPIQEAAELRRRKAKEEEDLRIRKEELRVEREKQKRQRMIIYIVSVAGIISILMSIFAYSKMKEAQREKLKATLNLQRAMESERKAKESLNNFLEEQRLKNKIKTEDCLNEAVKSIQAGFKDKALEWLDKAIKADSLGKYSKQIEQLQNRMKK